MSKTLGASSNNQSIQRRNANRARAQLSDADRHRASTKITSTVARSSWFARAERIGCYLATQFEVDTWQIILRAWRMKKRIFAPVTGNIGQMHFQEVTPESTLLRNQFGLFEPIDGEILSQRQLQIVLTPLVAFDVQRNRIGMGGGYYDRSFAFLKNRQKLFQPKLVGLAFDCQQVEKIAANPWDIRLYTVITEST